MKKFFYIASVNQVPICCGTLTKCEKATKENKRVKKYVTPPTYRIEKVRRMTK